MAKISINEAAKRLDVSRPTLAKHIKAGTVAGTKDSVKGWGIDTAELARVYPARHALRPRQRTRRPQRHPRPTKRATTK